MKLYCLILVSVTIGTTFGVPRKGRIFGGDPAAPGQFPSIVSINDPDQFCDGSIVSKNWVVTSAHCVDYVTSTTTILAGTNLANSGGTTHKVSKWINHEDYDNEALTNDIGLIQIEDEFEFDDVTQPTEFVDPVENATCSLAGWGMTDTVDFPDELQFVDQTIFSFDTCKSFVGDELVEEQICAFAQQGKGVCIGDSGGPLVCEGKLAGIVTYFIGGCGSGYPDFYTRTIPYVEWINKNIESK
ncbi:hypothetical protein Zmor_018896 [Zophobas morio]|uniref:Peptidase S1 domain-containing protein n=1 Tax=Zophobas morio TaxID=2755281 RepID=A0AA38MEF6_9CUCU|nr:hypothetical protein Zmor_018896 [Zophobas morio]